MEVKCLSKTYDVRTLTMQDVDIIYELCAGNPLFYIYHPPFVSRESILTDMQALPPHKGRKDKLYDGFFQEDMLVAILDLILDYPTKGVAFIGLFMMHIAKQGCGIGSNIIDDCADCLRQKGYAKIRLAIDKGNPQSKAFWTKNQFVLTNEVYPHAYGLCLAMERIL